MAWPSRISRQTRNYDLNGIWLIMEEAHGANEAHLEDRVGAVYHSRFEKSSQSFSQVMDLPC